MTTRNQDGDEVIKVRRYDRGTLRRARRDRDTGFLHVPASLTRAPAVFAYRTKDGGIRREFRPAEHVFSKRNMDSVRGAVVTDEHPKVRVNARNVTRFQAGHATGDVTQDADLMNSDLTVTNDTLADKMERGDARDCSLGYDCDLVMKPGVWTDEDGVRHAYDATQTNHVTNHIAIVPDGRAGPRAGAHMDGTDAEQIEGEQITMTTRSEDKDKPVTREDFLSLFGGGDNDKARVKIDGVEYEMPTAQAQAVATKQANDANELAAQTKKVDTAEAKIVALTKERDDEKKRAEDAEKVGSHDAVDARIALLVKAQPHFKDDAFKTIRTKPDAEIKKAVVGIVHKDVDLKEKSTDYIDALFDTIKAPDKKRKDALGDHVLDADDSRAPDDEDTSELQKRIDERIDQEDTQWKRPVPGGYTKKGPTPTNDHHIAPQVQA